MRLTTVAATAAFCFLVGGAAQAETLKFGATLKGSEEVPANTEKGTGKVDATLDTATKAFNYTVTYSGLTGPATAAHFHGPAAPGANAGPVVMLKPEPATFKGTATLTDAQVADLTSGKWYLNIHTAAHPPGEIRGQVMAMK